MKPYVVSYDVPYEVSYRDSYGEVNPGAGGNTKCEMISHCPEANSSRKYPGNTLVSGNQERRSPK